MHAFQNAMVMAADRVSNGIVKTRIGIITSYDPNTYMVKVMIQPENVQTGWLPLGSPMVGNNFGLFCAPNVGDQVEAQFVDGDMSSGVVSMRFFHDQARPLNVPSGEIWIVQQSGAFAKLTNDGKLTITDKAGSTVVLNGDGTATITASGGLTINANTTINGNAQVNGNVTASQQIADQNGTKGNMQTIRTTYDAHTHSGVQTGLGNTSTPSNSL